MVRLTAWAPSAWARLARMVLSSGSFMVTQNFPLGWTWSLSYSPFSSWGKKTPREMSFCIISQLRLAMM